MNNCHCKKANKTSSLELKELKAQFSLEKNVTGLIDKDEIFIIICQSVPLEGKTYAVKFFVNGAFYPLLDKFGDPVPACVLKKCQLYKFYFYKENLICYDFPLGCWKKNSYPCDVAEEEA